MKDYIIQTQQLTKLFDNQMIIRNLNLDVPKGSIFGLLGPNGAGKTTLIRMLMGILQPSSGEGIILGNSITDLEGSSRKKIGYVSDFQYMYPTFKVQEIIKFYSKLYPNWNEEKCKQLLKTLDISTTKPIRTLSKGMKTQLALILAISISPQLLILDEPTSGLDPAVKRHLMQIIMEEAAETGMTIFFSTHNMQDLERMSDRVALLMKGNLIFNDEIERVKANYNKLQVIFNQEIPREELSKVKEIIKVEQIGKTYSIMFEGNKEQCLKKLEKLNPTYVEQIDSSLEDIFINIVEREGYKYEEFKDK